MENLEINFEEITIRQHITSRGGGVEIDLESLGYPREKMTAYQNYLGGGMLGRVCSDCTVKVETITGTELGRLTEIANQLKRYYHGLTNPEDGEWESTTYEQNQNLPKSGY